MERELTIECPLCHAEPGTACGVESHPERVEAYEHRKRPIARKKPAKPHLVSSKKKHRRAA